MARDRKLYDVLGVSPEASADDVKKAYRKLARALHPDRNPGDKAAEERFKHVNAANEVLSDPEKRKLYDEFGPDALRAGFDPDQARAWGNFRSGAASGPGFDDLGAFDMDDLLGELFGRRQARGGGPRPGRSVRSDVSVDFRTAAQGGQRDLRFADGRTVTVRIPPGVRDGEAIRLKGLGEPSVGGGPDGDLVLTVHVEPHPVFEREGDDLHVVVPVTLGEAMLGATIEVPTLEAPVKLKVPPGTQSGQRLRLRGKGIARKGRSAGDLYAEILVRLPEKVDPEQLRDAIGQIERAYRGDVRDALTRKSAA